MKLFEPLTINRMHFKNRIVMPAMQLKLGLTNRRLSAFHRERAAGGVGAIIMSATAVDLFNSDAAWGRPGGVDEFMSRMRVINAEIRAAGAKIGIQLWHGNHFPAGNGAPGPGAEPVAPSATEDRRALRIAEIETIIDKFARAAANAQASDFDFVEIHGAHGYLVCQFFSGADNRRNDRYGGSVQKRMRFGLETVGAMRRAVGKEFPIFFRLGAEEKRPDGITLGQSRAFAVELEKAGVDALDISIGMPVGRNPSPTRKAKMGTFAYLAEAIKKEVSIPVMAVGRINRPEIAESILNEGRADAVGIGRQLIADPQWPNKVRNRQEQAIVACLSCNTCFKPLHGKWKKCDPICKINANAGLESNLGTEPCLPSSPPSD